MDGGNEAKGLMTQRKEGRSISQLIDRSIHPKIQKSNKYRKKERKWKTDTETGRTYKRAFTQGRERRRCGVVRRMDGWIICLFVFCCSWGFHLVERGCHCKASHVKPCHVDRDHIVSRSPQVNRYTSMPCHVMPCQIHVQIQPGQWNGGPRRART